MDICVSHMGTHMSKRHHGSWRTEEDVRPPGTRVAGDCEPTRLVIAVEENLGPCKSSEWCWLLGHLSSTLELVLLRHGLVMYSSQALNSCSSYLNFLNNRTACSITDMCLHDYCLCVGVYRCICTCMHACEKTKDSLGCCSSGFIHSFCKVTSLSHQVV